MHQKKVFKLIFILVRLFEMQGMGKVKIEMKLKVKMELRHRYLVGF